jgi:serine/threonine protein phosphatase PrpC
MNESKSSNVVRLDDHVKSPGFTGRARSGHLLKHCRELASSTLIGALPDVMDKLDDALFDLANRSTNNKEQGIYFETMREVRVKRASIESEFRRFFKESVRATIERLAGSGSSSSLADASSADLGLVDENDFEETLAVTNMVRKIRTNCKQLLYALERRIAELLAVDELKPEENPFGPEAMCNAFRDACGQIDANVEVRLIILKLFDRHVGAEAEKLYCEINDFLVAQGVLPEIRHHIKIQPSAGRPRGQASQQDIDHDGQAIGAPPHGMPPPQPYAGVPHAHAQTTGHWDSPPAPQHQTMHDGAAPMAGAGYVAPTSAVLLDALRQVMDVNFVNRAGVQGSGDDQLRVINQLTHLQHGNTQAACEELASLDVSGVHTGTVNVLRDLKQATMINGIGEMDAMMFDVVAMMFDFILDDKKIPAPMKALIGRLQIPMLKVAILDKAFFARKFHPARKFLNSIAEAAVGWSEDKDRNDALYNKLESMVGRVLDEFDERVDVFAEVIVELEAFLDKEESQAVSNASTFADDIQGRERLTLARKNAEEQVTHCLEKATIHSVVREFLIGQWKELLFIRHFEEGDTGEGWTNAVQTMDDLVWSVAPKTLDQDRNHLTETLPGLLRRVRDGMKQLGMPAEISSDFLGVLKKLHIAAIRNETCVGDPEEIEEVSEVNADKSGADVDVAEIDPDNDVQGIDLQWSDTTSYSVEELSLIQLAIERANDVIYGTAEVRPECAGMGTTLVAVQFNDNRLTAAHVGDARLYRLRGSVFQRLTADHSLRQQLVEKGIYTAEEVEEKVYSNIITRAIGPESSVDVEVQELATERDDLYLLCSDGLTDMVDDAALAEILCGHSTDLATAGRILVDKANENGGQDNISVVLARVVDAYPETMPGDEHTDLKAKLDMYGFTDVGRKRSHNEDHIALDAERGIAIVADGMGGCNAGEVASEMAVKIILEALRNGSVDAIAVTTGDGTRTSRVTAEEQLTETTSAADALLRHHGDEIIIEGLGTDVAYELEEEDEFTEAIRNLEVGSWVEFHHVDGATTPARLTWLSPVTGRYLFTDRKGMKVADATVHGLAVEMRRGNVAVIEGVPLFDRIIGTISENLHADGARAH